MKVLSEKMNVLGLDTTKLSKSQLATASSDAIDQKFKKVIYLSYYFGRGVVLRVITLNQKPVKLTF